MTATQLPLPYPEDPEDGGPARPGRPPAGSASAVTGEAAVAPAPAPRYRDAALAVLEEVTDRVGEATREAEAAPDDAVRRARLANTIQNARTIAVRARRAVESVPGADLELLRAHGRLVAAIGQARRARETTGPGAGFRGRARGV